MKQTRNTRKTFVGTVVSDKNDKTIKVLVTFTRKHPIYGKRIETSKKFTAHDEHNEAKVGDIVKIPGKSRLPHGTDTKSYITLFKSQ